jgi:HK97 family phage portal protein
MGLLARLLGPEEKSTPLVGPLDLFRDLLTAGRTSRSGVTVSNETALQVTTVLSASRVIAEDVSGLPLRLYQQDGTTRRHMADDPIQALLDQPNDWQTGQEFREQLTMHAVLAGNGIAWKNVVRGQVRELLPLQPGWVTIEQGKDWALRYKVRLPDGTAFTLLAKDVLHLRGPSWAGFAGLEIVRLAREAIGLALATEEAHATLHSNGLQTTGLYSVEGTLTGDQYAQLRAHIEAHQMGPANAFKPFILDRNAKYAPKTMTGVDAQHIETRKHQIEEIGRAMRVFPQMLGHSDKTSTFASAEQFFLAHVKYTLMPWVNRWEGVGRRDLIGRNRPGVYLKHNVAALERADIKTRYQAYGQGIKDGWLLRNEARSWEELDEIEGLSEPLQPLNMATPGQAEAEQQEQTKAIAAEIRAMIGHNGGPALDDGEIERRVGRVLSGANERRIRGARDDLSAVLEQLGEEDDA